MIDMNFISKYQIYQILINFDDIRILLKKTNIFQKQIFFFELLSL